MYGLLITISILVAILLIIVVLLQSSKGTGLAGTFGGAAGGFGTMFGSRRTADFLSKSTWWLGGALIVLSIVINLFFLPGQTTSEQRESIIQGAHSSQAVPTAPALPAQSAPAQSSGQSQQPQSGGNGK